MEEVIEYKRVNYCQIMAMMGLLHFHTGIGQVNNELPATEDFLPWKGILGGKRTCLWLGDGRRLTIGVDPTKQAEGFKLIRCGRMSFTMSEKPDEKFIAFVADKQWKGDTSVWERLL